jgi:hypothetical protein
VEIILQLSIGNQDALQCSSHHAADLAVAAVHFAAVLLQHLLALVSHRFLLPNVDIVQKY